MISTEFEERLRAEMRHATTGVSAPPGLVRRARRDRRRRIVSRASAACAAAAVVVAGAVIVSNGTTGASRDSGTYTTAYVVKHVESAMDAVNEIASVRYVSSPSYVSPMDLWVYDGPQGQAYRAEYFETLGGRLFEEIGMTATPASYQTWTVVNPIHKTWSRQSSPGPTPPRTGCGTPLPMSLTSFPELAEGIRGYLACGTLRYEGKQQVDGVNALKLVSVEHQRQGKTVATLTTIIWVDPATFLPVRLTTQWTRPVVSLLDRFDFRWLPPTSANLALLKVRIPPGFTQVRPPH